MSLPNPSQTPPLLLTKRLNAFLHANQSPLLPTLLLATAHGKLLAHAGAQPVSTLRTHATVAASLLAIHTSASVEVPSALPGARCPPDDESADDESAVAADGEDDDVDDDNHVVITHGRAHRRPAGKAVQPAAITVQLSGGTVVIRRLKCNLLFVAIGPSAQDYHPPDQHHHHHHHHDNGDTGGSPSEAESMASAGGQTTSSLESVSAASVVAMRRHAGELARWLDDRLDTLKVPREDGSIVSD